MKQPAINQFARFRFLSGLLAAPSGKEAAFALTHVDEQEDCYRHSLWLLEGGDRLREITPLEGSPLFAWEDDRTLLFAAGRPSPQEKERGEVFTEFRRFSLEDGQIRDGFRLPLAVEKIRPLRDGLFLVLAPWEQPASRAPAPSQRSYQVIEELPFWADGKGFISGKRKRLSLYDAGSGRITPITDEAQDVEGFRVGPRGDRFVYSVGTHPVLWAGQQSLWEYRLEAGAARRLLEEALYIHDFDYWQEDIILAGTDGAAFGFSENPALYRLTAGKAPFLLCRPDLYIGGAIGSDCRFGRGLSFQVAGDSLYFTAIKGYESTLFRLTLPQGELSPLTRPGVSVDQFDASGASPLLVCLRGQEPQELYRLEASALSPLSSFNRDALADTWVGNPVHHVSRRGGCPVDGWALLPRDYRPDRQYPAILNIHGGPKMAFGEAYFHEMQYWAGQGYFVLFCNPRGGDGKGNEFSDIRGKYGTIDCDDILGFLEEMLSVYPAIDPRRVGVTGGSYGGFMVNWLIGHTDRFAAAASQRGIANWITMTLTSDIGLSFVPDQIGGNPWDNTELLWDRSPLKYAPKVTTPTLFLHSDEDYRCWIADCYQMFTALKQREVPCRACVFHGESHDLSRMGKPSNRIGRLREITAWMERYCK